MSMIETSFHIFARQSADEIALMRGSVGLGVELRSRDVTKS